MKIIDLSLPIEEGMMTFPTHWHPVVEVTVLGRHGIEGRETRKIVLGTHTGTHADAPRHFIPNGGTIDEIPLEILIGPASVADFTDCRALQEIWVKDLQQKLGAKVPPRLILRTGWSEHFGKMKFYNEYPFLPKMLRNGLWIRACASSPWTLLRLTIRPTRGAPPRTRPIIKYFLARGSCWSNTL